MDNPDNTTKNNADNAIKNNQKYGWILFALPTFLFYALILAFRKIDMGCSGICAVLLIMIAIIYNESKDVRTSMKRLFCDTIFRQGGIFHVLCIKKLLTRLIGIMTATFVSCQLLIFLFNVEWIFLLILFSELFVVVYIPTNKSRFQELFCRQYNPGASKSYASWAFLFLNSALLMGFYMFYSYVTLGSSFEVLSIDIPDKVIQEIKHSCDFFQDVVRTAYYFDLNLKSLINLSGSGKLLFVVLFIANFSLIPFVGMTLMAKWFSNFEFPFSISKKSPGEYS